MHVRVCGARFPNMPRYREIYRLSVTCTFLDRPKPPFAPTFFSPPITRTSIRRLAPQHQILYIPLEKRSLKVALRYFINHPLNRAQFPPRLIDFSKITETKTSPKKRGREREREREKRKGITGTLFTSYGGNSELGHVRPVESLELYVLLVSLLIALPRRNSETFLLWAVCTERFCVNEFQRWWWYETGKIRVPRGWWCRLVENR